ncbi:4'-phosphopantetheinyl transferase family protein [Leifsonia poae]|uniref:4'-phosphopantetheinyl transferase family protein n=1 Tax=Leifsonia poae TaxID=110933 RepID=UPI001CC12CAE|nr:4-phosphopantetheinyl transferase [Leifsonia poae]
MSVLGERRDRGLLLRVVHGTLSGRPVLRELVSELCGVPVSSVLIQARCPDCGGAHGRPVVMAPAAATRIRVSLSHVGDTVVAAASLDRAVGVDAEPADAATDPERTTAIEHVSGREGADPLARWTSIEAVLKADGRGLRVDPSAVTFGRSVDGVRMLARLPDSDRVYEVWEAAADPELRISVAREL